MASPAATAGNAKGAARMKGAANTKATAAPAGMDPTADTACAL